MSQINCNNLSVGYDGKAILKNINFSVDEGDYLCIVGENGSGKTTLMKTILGLQQPVAGNIIYGDGLKKNEIGYLPQQTFVQKDFPASVREIILSGCQNRCGMRPFYNKVQKQTAKNMMEKFEISNNVYCLQEHCVQQKRYCFLMNQWQHWILRLQKRCIKL